MLKNQKLYFKYVNEEGETKWYVSEVIEILNLEKSFIMATVIDPSFHEFETVCFFNVNPSKIKFYKDKYEFLVSEWGAAKATEYLSKL